MNDRIEMNKKKKLRPVGTKIKIIREPIPYSNEIRKRCIEWEIIGYRKAFKSLADKKGEWLEEIRMVSEKIIKK